MCMLAHSHTIRDADFAVHSVSDPFPLNFILPAGNGGRHGHNVAQSFRLPQITALC